VIYLGKMSDGKAKKYPQYANPLEAFKDLGRSTSNSLKKELVQPMGRDFVEQIIGRKIKKSYSGEIMPGESLEINDVYSGKRKEFEESEKLLQYEQKLVKEEKLLIERRTNELRIEIKSIHEEIVKLAKVTPRLSREVDIAAFQAPISPSTYEVFFLKQIFNFIKSFRQNVEEASYWLSRHNKRAATRNKWGANLKKHGAKYLLSGEHYLQRSAG